MRVAEPRRTIAGPVHRTRPLALGERGMVATPHHLASLAAVRLLLEGANAVDAAVAASAALCVVYPHMAGVGGDLMALVWDARAQTVHALNASGRAPAAASWTGYRGRGLTSIPTRGPLSLTVPGAIDGWDQLLGRFGSRTLGEILLPAIEYADGVPLGATLADRLTRDWPSARQGRESSAFDRAGSGAKEGQRWAQPELAATLRRLGERGARDLYTGELAERLASAVRGAGGLLTVQDLAAHRSEWVRPLESSYRGVRILELPPNTQGVTALQIIAMLDAQSPREPFDSERVHLGVEATKLAMADRAEWIADPARASVPVDRLLDARYLAGRRGRIAADHAARAVGAGGPAARGDTVHIAVADRDGNLISLIESLFESFGSGIVAGDTGILMHNRGAAFSLDENSPNRLEPGKRPLHTLIPAMAFKGADPWLAFGSMGGDGQAQFHAQLLEYVVDDGLDLQASIEMPRWLCGRWSDDDPAEAVHLEARFPRDLRTALAKLGHPIVDIEAWDRRTGHAQAVAIDRSTGFYQGAADPRGEGLALGW